MIIPSFFARRQLHCARMHSLQTVACYEPMGLIPPLGTSRHRNKRHGSSSLLRMLVTEYEVKEWKVSSRKSAR